MKKHLYRNKFTQILCAFLLITICCTVVADEAVSQAVDGMYRRAVATYDNKNYKSALKQFRKMQKEFPMSKHAVRGWEYVAQCENLLGDKYAAFEAYQKIWDNHKNFNKLSTITKNQMTIANDFFKMKRYKIAIEIYGKIIANAPYSDFAAAAQYLTAESLLKRENYFAAKEEYRKLIRNYPMSQYVDDAAFNLGYVDYLQSVGKDYDQTETTQAIIEFRQFIHEFPSSPRVSEAQDYIIKLRNRKAASLFRTGEYYENIRAPKAASISFREVIEQYPDTDYADKARNKINKINKSKVEKSVQAQQVAKMVRLENKKELARNRDLAGAERVKQKPGQKEEKYNPDVTTGAKQKSEADRNKEYAARIKELYTDPEMREELRLTMKDVYLNEKIQDKKRRKAWKQQEIVKQVAPIKPEQVEEIAETSIDEQKTDEQVEAESAEYQRELVEEITPESFEDLNSDAVENAVADSETESTETLPENFKIENVKTEQSYNNEQNYKSIDTGDEELSVEYKTVDAAVGNIEETASQPAEEVAVPSISERTAEIPASQPVEKVAVQSASEETPETAVPQPVEKNEQSDKTPETVAKNESKDVEQSRIEEQERAERVRKMVEYIKNKGKDKKIQTRRLSGVGNVRRAKTTNVKKKNSSDALQQQYVPIYYLIISGDSAFQRGVFSDAKRFYGKALDGLLDIKEKDPEWKSDIVNWRIDHCRKQLRKIK